jgi:LPXTG-site transpeptidase (sortase) family protein
MQMGAFADDTYYERNGVTFTPDYAVGYLFCVLEYPNVGIRRGVYSGTWDDIYDDLGLWMVTMARPDMELGRTHLAIYGHNHTSQNLSFNNLKNAAIGDSFYLYAESGIYTYEVADIFSDWRTDTTKKYVDDFSIGSDICYIITCGRDNFLIGGQSTRYQDFIVEGHLTSKQLLSEYAQEQLEAERSWSEK